MNYRESENVVQEYNKITAQAEAIMQNCPKKNGMPFTKLFCFQRPELDIFNNKEQFVEIFNRGKVPFEFTVTTDVPWLTVSESKGIIDQADKRVWVKLNEKLLPKGKTQGNIIISGAGQEVTIAVQAFNPKNISYIKGFVESGGLIAIEAEHFSKNKEEGDRK